MPSQDSNYDPRFRQLKKQIESQPFVLDDLETHPINAPLSLLELDEGLATTRNSSPGHDDIPIAFLTYHSPLGKQILLKTFNLV